MWLSFISTVAFLGTQGLPWWYYLALLLGVGTIDGDAILVGHELDHKPDRLNRTFGLLANNTVGYAHFRIEHNRGHHTWVATPEDPASARFGESIYAFAAFDDLPRLPSGYPGMFVLAAIPPLWFRVMNPKALAWAGGDVTKLHVASRSRA